MAVRKPGSTFSTFVRGGTAEAITYGDVYARSCAYARAYSNAGVKRGDIVLVILQHTPHLFYSFFGALIAGAVPSFMPFPTPKQRADMYWGDHKRLFDRIAPSLIVTYAENRASALATLPDLRVPFLIAGDELLETPGTDELPGLHSGYDDVACLQHSSGTTGLKKGVMLTHRAIDLQVEAYARSIGLDDDDRIASWLPLYHDMGFVTSFLMVAMRGLHVVSIDPFEWVMRPRMLLDAIERYQATLTWLPNFAFSHLANACKPDARWELSSMRAFINCSEPCKALAFERFLARFSTSGVTAEMLSISYAMAENVFGVTQTQVGRAPRAHNGVLSCGPPISGVSVEIRVGDRLAAEGETGEIAISSPFLFSGYYLQEDLTRAKLRDGWYRTGDLGFVDDGEVFVTGRIDDMLIVNGRNYYAHDFEELAGAVPGVVPGRTVAVGIDDAVSGAVVVVVIVECRDESEFPTVGNEIKGAILERFGLAVHSVVVVPPGRLVKTTSGKISRDKNKALYLSGDFTHAGGAS
jgi:acyl-CoA synthetase (AMP-forming)/AMP-acid ligase II